MFCLYYILEVITTKHDSYSNNPGSWGGKDVWENKNSRFQETDSQPTKGRAWPTGCVREGGGKAKKKMYIFIFQEIVLGQ